MREECAETVVSSTGCGYSRTNPHDRLGPAPSVTEAEDHERGGNEQLQRSSFRVNGDDGEESGVCGFARRRLRLVIETGSFLGFWQAQVFGFPRMMMRFWFPRTMIRNHVYLYIFLLPADRPESLICTPQIKNPMMP